MEFSQTNIYASLRSDLKKGQERCIVGACPKVVVFSYVGNY
jgi:hypothetical protein